MTDLLTLTAELVAIPSVSHHERAIVDHLEAMLASVPWLTLTRVGENLVARTERGNRPRLVLAGHVDTVPPNGNELPRIEGDVCWGLGAVDMKSGVAVLVELARTVAEPAVDVTYVLYECEEVGERFNGLERLFLARPDLLVADAAVLAEPTGSVVEAGCQGTMRLQLVYEGVRAHTARGWLGRNAVHRMAPALAALASYEGRRVRIEGCEFVEGMQAVRVEGGVAGNVVPDRAVLTVNHRFAPDRSAAEAEAHMRAVLGPADEVTVIDAAPAAAPSLAHPLLHRLLAASGGPATAKLGWTDVARFAARGVPAANFGPGDPNLAHHADEAVDRADLDRCYDVLRSLITAG